MTNYLGKRTYTVSKTVEQRLNEKTDKSQGADGCWRWLGSTTSNGYGNLTITLDPFGNRLDKSEYAHRTAWAIAHGRWPEKGRVLRHSCDNPLCVNPSHLIEGTQRENVADRTARSNWNSAPKLTEQEVRHIRSCSDSQITLARKYNTTQTTISNVRRGRTYKYVN